MSSEVIERKKQRFLELFLKTGNAAKAARAVGWEACTPFYHRRVDAAFAEAWDQAKEIVADRVEEVAMTHALGTALKPIIYEGQVTGHVNTFSERMAERILEAYKPERYGRNSNGSGAIEIKILNINEIREQRAVVEEKKPLVLERKFAPVEIEVDE